MTEFSTLIATVGVGLLLLAFVLRSWDLLDDGYLHSGLNAVGSALSAYASYLIEFVPFVVLEGAWFVAAALSIVRLRRMATQPAAAADPVRRV